MTTEEVGQAVAGCVTRDGWGIIPNLVPSDTLRALRRTADGILYAQRRREERERAEDNFGSRRARELLRRHEVFWQCALDPTVTACAELTLGPGFHLGAAALNEVSPGARAQKLHRDDEHFSAFRPFQRPVVLNTIWALNDFTIESGATRFVSGSHRDNDRPTEDGRLAYAEMPAGSVFIFDGSLWHGSSTNSSPDRRRVGLVLTYCASFLRPFESQLRGFSVRRLERLPEDRLLLVAPSLDVKLQRRAPRS